MGVCEDAIDNCFWRNLPCVFPPTFSPPMSLRLPLTLLCAQASGLALGCVPA